MINLKKPAFLLIVITAVACFSTNPSLAQINPVDINVCEKVEFTEWSFKYTALQDDPFHATPPNLDPIRTALITNNTASTSVTAGAGQVGMASAQIGVQFNLILGSMNWVDVKEIPVKVEIDFEYTIQAMYVEGWGSANGNATYNSYGPDGDGWPAYANIGYETTTTGTESNSVKVNFQTTYGELYSKFSNKIIVVALSQAGVVWDTVPTPPSGVTSRPGASAITHAATASVTLNRITLTPLCVPELRQINIDIKPGSYPNSINSADVGKIPVAIISTQEFHAVEMINPDSLTFGPTGDEQSLGFCNTKGEDINKDGILDLVCHFITLNAHFKCGDNAGILRGETVDGTPVEGVDSVRIIPCK